MAEGNKVSIIDKDGGKVADVTKPTTGQENQTKTDNCLNTTDRNSMPATIVAGEKDVAVAGTPVALAASTACRGVLIMAKTTNIGYIYVGISGACSSTRYIARLSAGETVEISVQDLADIYIDSSVNTEGTYFYYFRF